jgi:hypothetical protein
MSRQVNQYIYIFSIRSLLLNMRESRIIACFTIEFLTAMLILLKNHMLNYSYTLKKSTMIL